MQESTRGIADAPFLPTPRLWDKHGVAAAWLGHSTVLLNFYGLHILTDPVLFRRVGVDLRMGTVGPKRLVAPALQINQLPPVHLVLLSHAHMDHFDLATLRCFPASTRAVVPRRTGDLLAHTRLQSALELGWGEKTIVKTAAGKIAVTSFLVNHWGARWRHDSYRGYSGYILEREGRKILFGGDTAFATSFAGLRERGPFELAIMPIGAYQPWVQSHCTPEQAVQMANAAGAHYILPIHHKTFALGREGPREPMQRLESALEKERIGWREIGQTFFLS